MELFSHGCSRLLPSSMPSFSMMLAMRSEPNRRIKSSSSEMKKWDEPGSPWRAQRPRNWRSMRRDSCRSVPMTHNPWGCSTRNLRSVVPSYLASKGRFDLMTSRGIVMTPSPSLMSVPRPAMLVAIVIAPLWPARDDNFGFALVVLRVQHVVRDVLRAAASG